MSQTENGSSGQSDKLIPAGTKVATPLATSRPALKRSLMEDSPEGTSELEAIEQNFRNGCDFPKEPPEGVHPMLWNMLRIIQRDVSKINDVQSQVSAIDDQIEKDGTEIAKLKLTTEQLISANKTLTGRLLRAETTIQRQQAQIVDLKTRSMRDNLIIKTSGATYKEIRDEKTDVTIRKFLRDEMRIPDAEGITINSSHRMGQASGNYNRMLIARIPKRGDHNKIFDNAKILHGSNYSITKQIPPEIDERRQFAWAEYKKAKSEKKPARFDGGTLVVGGTPVSRFQPLTIPAIGTSLRGLPSPTLACGSSDVTVEGHHTFQAWAIPAQSVGDVREGLDQLLQKGDLAGATHVPYAYRFTGVDGRLIENFESDGDTNAGIQTIRILRELQAENVAIFVAHNAYGEPIPRRKKNECLASVISGAVMALTAIIDG